MSITQKKRFEVFVGGGPPGRWGYGTIYTISNPILSPVSDSRPTGVTKLISRIFLPIFRV